MPEATAESPKKTNAQSRSRDLLQFAHSGVAASPFGGAATPRDEGFLEATLSGCLSASFGLGGCSARSCAEEPGVRPYRAKSAEFVKPASACFGILPARTAITKPLRGEEQHQGNVTNT